MDAARRQIVAPKHLRQAQTPLATTYITTIQSAPASNTDPVIVPICFTLNMKTQRTKRRGRQQHSRR
jgi:hypothetical protein